MSMFVLKNSGWKVGLIAALAVSLVACGGGGGGGGVNDPRIRYVNASPDTDPVTFSLDNNDRATGVAYLDLSPAFQEEDQNSYDVAVREDGTTPALDAFTAQFGNENEYLVVCVGLKNFGSEPFKRVRLANLQINLTAPNGNRSRLYVLHAFNREGGLDTPNIDLRNPGDNPQYKVENIAFGSIGMLEIDASTQTFVARRNDSESVYATGTFTFSGGGIYLAIVGGIENATGVQEPQIKFVRLN